MEQRSTEWFEARKARLTGSEVGAALGLSPFATPEQLIRQKVRAYHGYPSELPDFILEYGRNHEEQAKLAYTIQTGNLVEDVGFLIHPKYDWLGASPAGVLDSGFGLLEVKCPFSLRKKKPEELVFKNIKDQPHYYAQIQMQLHCADAEYCDFFQWAEYGHKLEFVQKDENWLIKNLPELRSFYDWFISEINNEQHLKPLREQIKNDNAKELLQEYLQVNEQIDNLNARKKELLQEIVKAAGEKDCEIDGHKLTKVQKSGSISYAKALKAIAPDADLEPYRGKPVEYWKLS